MAKKILVVGSMNMDLTIRAPRRPDMGETLTGFGFASSPGGKGANQAAACARLGAEVKMIGCVGNDIYGKELVAALEGSGADCAAVETAVGESGIAVITVVNGDNCIILDEGANAKVSEEVLLRHEELFEWADTVLLQLEIPVDTVLLAAKLGRKYGDEVILNPAPMKPLSPVIAQYIDWFVPNETEAAIFLGHDVRDIEDAARQIQNMGMKNVLITLGNSGCIAAYGDKLYKCGIFPVETVDTTAAGDSFIGGFAVCGGNIEEKLRFASAAAALTVGRRGAQTALPSLDETEAFLAEFGS